MNDRIERIRAFRRITCGSVVVAALAYGCRSETSTQPPATGGRGSITVIAGAGQTDTVLTILPQPLVVQVRDSTGKIATGHTVRFLAVIDTLGNPGVRLTVIGQQNFTSAAFDVADAQGFARAVVQMGVSPGTARVVVTVPELAAVDTVSFTVKPGAP